MINEKLAEIEEKYDLNTAVMADGFGEEGESDTEEEDAEDDTEETTSEEIE